MRKKRRYGQRRQRENRPIQICSTCKNPYKQRYRPNGGVFAGYLCCPVCANPEGKQ